jgi:hypothetical protein
MTADGFFQQPECRLFVAVLLIIFYHGDIIAVIPSAP